MVELSNIPFSRMFTCLSYERQNVAEKMEIIAGKLPKTHLGKKFGIIWSVQRAKKYTQCHALPYITIQFMQYHTIWQSITCEIIELAYSVHHLRVCNY